MLKASPTEHLTGITLQGDWHDFNELVDCIYRVAITPGVTLEEDYQDPYWTVKTRLLGLCYEVRHANMGARDIELVDNGVIDEMLNTHSMILPRNAVYFSVNILFSEAVFIALSVSEVFSSERSRYGHRTKKQEENAKSTALNYSDYLRDTAILQNLSAVILGAFAEAAGDYELEKLMKLKECQGSLVFWDYAAQYIDKCNREYLKTAPEKRAAKLYSIARRFLSAPNAYISLLCDLKSIAREYHCSMHELYDPGLNFPEEFEW